MSQIQARRVQSRVIYIYMDGYPFNEKFIIVPTTYVPKRPVYQAVQYHWILDKSVLYLSESARRAKYKQDKFNVQ